MSDSTTDPLALARGALAEADRELRADGAASACRRRWYAAHSLNAAANALVGLLELARRVEGRDEAPEMPSAGPCRCVEPEQRDNIAWCWYCRRVIAPRAEVNDGA